MFIKKFKTDQSRLDDAINNALQQLDYYPAHTEEYAKTLAVLEKLYSFKTANRRERLKPDTLAIVLGNLLGIAIIVGYERANILTSNAKNFVMKAAR